MAIKTFTTGELLTASDTNTYLANSGLVYITSVAIPASPAISTIPVSNCFSNTYDNYRIILGGISGTVSNAPITMALNSSTGATFLSTSAYMVYGSTGFNGYAPAAATVFRIGWTDTTADINLSMDIISPFLAKPTTFSSQSANLTIAYQSSGRDSASISNTGFTLAGDNFTTGFVTVYGYRKA